AVVRRTGVEYGKPITVGSDVWIGGHVTVCPGVPIGDNVVIGAGSVVVHDIPSDSVAVGSPACVGQSLPPRKASQSCCRSRFAINHRYKQNRYFAQYLGGTKAVCRLGHEIAAEMAIS